MVKEAKSKPLVRDKCPECGSTNLIHDYDTGETVCGGCGLVIQDVMIDKGPEWRAFTQEEKKSRVHSSLDRNLAQAMAELDRLSDKVAIPNAVKEKAAVIYRKALDKGLVRGRSIAAIAAASLYAACRITGTPRSLREISEASLVNRKDVARCYRLLLRELDIKMPIADPLTYLPKIAERSKVSGHTQALAMKILQEARRRHVSAGKDPMGLAAAALYIACMQANEKKTQKDIAEAANITEVTVRNRYKTLKTQLNLELPN